MKRVDSRVFEVVVCRSQPGATREAVVELGRKLQAWVEAQPGFVRRSLLHDEAKGTWVDLVEWRDLASAEAAAKAMDGHASMDEIARLLDVQTMTMLHASPVAL